MKGCSAFFVYSFYVFGILIYLVSAPIFLCASTIVFALLHELGHLLCAKALGRRISVLCFSPTGLYPSVGTGDALSSAVIYASGPMVNIMSSIVLYLLDSAHPSDMLSELFYINAALALFNLLPIPFSDGSGLLRCFLWRFLKVRRAESACRIIELLFSSVIFMLFSYRFFIAPGGFFSFFLSIVFVLAAISNVFKE